MQLFKTHTDDRGIIEEICKNADVLRITSKIGSRRASHYHKATGHWCLVTRGSLTYFARPVNSQEKPTKKVYYKDDIFWTPPMEEHLMVFDEFNDNEFLCFSTGDRSQSNYEADLVRIEHKLDEIFYSTVV